MAVNCFVVPGARLGFVGDTLIEASVAGVTLSVVVPAMLVDGSVAVIVVDPMLPLFGDVANPLDPFALLIVAIVVSDELHVTDVVMGCVVLSVYVPVAMNWFVRPLAMLGFASVTAIDTSAALVTLSVVVPDMLVDGSIAVIVVGPVLPLFGDVANPFDPFALLIVEIDVSDELHVTDAVRSWFVLSVNMPVALNCFVVPSAMLGLVGVT